MLYIKLIIAILFLNFFLIFSAIVLSSSLFIIIFLYAIFVVCLVLVIKGIFVSFQKGICIIPIRIQTYNFCFGLTYFNRLVNHSFIWHFLLVTKLLLCNVSLIETKLELAIKSLMLNERNIFNRNYL